MNVKLFGGGSVCMLQYTGNQRHLTCDPIGHDPIRRLDMKKTIVFLLCFILFTTTASAGSGPDQTSLTIAFNDTISKPWKWQENGHYVGPFLDLMDEIARRSGITLTLEPLPWKRVLVEMKAGAIDGFMGGYKTPDRESFADFLEMPITWSMISIFVLKGNEFPFNSIEDLYGKTIGIIRGYTTSSEFDTAWKLGRIKVYEVGNYVNLVKMLDSERLETIAGATSTLKAHFIDMKMQKRFVALPHPVDGPKPVYICLSKAARIPDRENLIARMNQAVKDIESEHVFEKIAAKYGYDKCLVFGCEAR
jgi:polar amino acid transport system substrate-binding protein